MLQNKQAQITRINDGYYFIATNGEEGTLIKNNPNFDLQELANTIYPGHKEISYKEYIAAVCNHE